MVLLYNPPAFSTKISLFLRNRGRWFRISTSFSPQTSSFGDIHISSIKSDRFSNLTICFALLFEKMHLLIHPQRKYPTYTLKSKYTLRTLMNIINTKTLKIFEKKILNRKIVTKVYMTTTSWSTSCIFQKVVKCKYLRN